MKSPMDSDAVRYKQDNRTTTVNSLMAVCYLITAKTKEEFAMYYRAATHDDAGIAAWSAMDLEGITRKKINERNKRLYYKNKELQQQKTRGTK